MQFHIAKAAATTGNTLRALVLANLAAEGVNPNGNAEVCYGVGYRGNNPALNANCSQHSKLTQAKLLMEGLGLEGLPVLATEREAVYFLEHGDIPLLARNLVHSKGRDIKIAMEPWQVGPLLASGSGFFTPYVHSVREFRTWVYRKRHLGTYEKMLRRPADFKRIGRNHDNGFDFSGIENDDVPETIKAVARKAIKVLGLDFGAVDIIQKPTGALVVLEVNSAPGVSDERRKVIQSLAKRVSRWVLNGCPARED
jgi:hypothetical protein